ncbi:hypothetical protein [Desulfobotulus pelophilus]|uniref:hypothetical protein n=1 Tax=Desulfobotulus pelophilus TaxID=2823377 RepID=UPI0034A3BFC4
MAKPYLAETQDLSASDQYRLNELTGLYRSRLYDISWFNGKAAITQKKNTVAGNSWITSRFKGWYLPVPMKSPATRNSGWHWPAPCCENESSCFWTSFFPP